MKQAIGYIRVSTEKQANEGVSLEAQEAKIVTWCKANGYELVKVYVDAGISGKRMDTRKELLAALAFLKKGMALVSYSLSRLARSTKHLIEISELVSKKKGDLVSLTEKIDTTTPMGEMMFTLMAGMAQLERRMISDRTSTALQHKKRSGLKYTNQTPYGFEAIEGRLVEVKQEAEIVAEIQAARSSGSTLQAIANNLNGRGIPTKTGKTWAPATIHLLLKRSSLVAAI
ncbi:recombinase family protein [Hydrogenophaga atypica]|uniref:Recombinase family protein n=1 Tax=Hydrogenophaga atypica TaxID=249409 RepID=A0ABW2QQG2_9BURK